MTTYNVYYGDKDWTVTADGHFFSAESTSEGSLFLVAKGKPVAAFPAGTVFIVDQSTMSATPAAASGTSTTVAA